MCMHNDRLKVDILIDYLSEMDEQELDCLQEAIDRRRGSLKKNNKEKQSTVLERREHRNGLLQLEGRAYKRKKNGKLSPSTLLTVELRANSEPEDECYY